jgi:uncharacterized protein (DUF1810 family)
MTTRTDVVGVAEIDLQRFIHAQHESFDRALSEIEAGRKTSHWMWYVFPQVSGLGFSPTSKRYAIASVEEAKAFMAHPVLGPHYRRLVDAVWHQVVESGVTVRDLFGSPDDAKLVSSLTLFAGVAADDAEFVDKANAILEAAYGQGFGHCTVTQQRLTTDAPIRGRSHQTQGE